MNYPIECRYCDEVIDSHDSVADSMSEYRDHLRAKHPEKEIPSG